MPVPSAVMSVPICSLDSILSVRTRSTLRILPRSGSTAWNSRLRPCLALPPAESPSTMNSSDLAGSFSWQSASLPGSEEMLSGLLRVSSRALRAASRAAAAWITLPTMTLASLGCSSNRSEEHTSELQSQSNLVCRLLLEKKKKHYVPRYYTQTKAHRTTCLFQPRRGLRAVSYHDCLGLMYVVLILV